MADKDKKEGAEAKEAPPPAKKAPIKVIGIVAGLMIAEAAGVFVLVGMIGHKPAAAEAEIHGTAEDNRDTLIEMPLVDEKFQNMQTGQIWIWDVQVVLKVKKKNQDFVTTELEARQAEIEEGIAQIIRRAQHTQLKEVELKTLNRQLTAYLDRILGPDPEGASRIDRVMIPKCKGFEVPS